MRLRVWVIIHLTGSHSSSSPYDPTGDFFSWLVYFPGDKIYGLSWNEDLAGCPYSAGRGDIPGNMAAPQFRRMKVGSFMSQRNASSSGAVCGAFSQSVHVSVQGDSGRGSPPVYIDATLNVSRDAGGAVSVRVVSPAGTAARLGLRAQVLPFRQYHGLLKLELWDTHEAACLVALEAMSCAPRSGAAHSCGVCALEHLAILKAAGCTTENNWKDVVEFWCGCTGGEGNDNSCGGLPYPTSNATA